MNNCNSDIRIMHTRMDQNRQKYRIYDALLIYVKSGQIVDLFFCLPHTTPEWVSPIFQNQDKTTS